MEREIQMNSLGHQVKYPSLPTNVKQLAVFVAHARAVRGIIFSYITAMEREVQTKYYFGLLVENPVINVPFQPNLHCL
jgi:hypothetical protein